MKIIQRVFDIDSANELSSKWYGKNWPVVYILNNNKEAYIGETISISNRMKQHLDNSKREGLKETSIIIDKRFNKSAILDIESKLIECMSADQKYRIQNSNSGMRNHNYYDKSIYDSIFKVVWSELRKRKIVNHDLDTLYNSEIFKYTPYKRLTEEQHNVMYSLVIDILDSMLANTTSTTMINGEAGTGKTVLAMYLIKLFTDNKVLEFISEEDEENFDKYKNLDEQIRAIKIGLVVPMTSLRGTLRKVARNIDGLNANMIIGPNDVVKEEYDLLIVDESHRLYRRKSMTGYGSYDAVNRSLGFDREATQLEWILNRSKYNIFFYDSTQTVRPSDIRKDDFMELMKVDNYSSYRITSQLRVLGGEDYIGYIGSILNNHQSEVKSFSNYDFRIFDSIGEMQTEIMNQEKEHGLSRLVAGFAWPWTSKGKTYKQSKLENIYDIDIEGVQLLWNSSNSSWVTNEDSVNEVGSIHTIQGYDLNYVGVIIGNDLIYNKDAQRIEVVKENYFDSKGKSGILNEEELKEYIINIYKVLLTRGIRGTYVYVCDPDLREYFKKFIPLNT